MLRFVSDTFGALYIQGIQIALAGGGIQGIGPFAIPCSGVQDTQTRNITTAVTTVAVPTAPALPSGVVIIPPIGGVTDTNLIYKNVIGDSGINLSPFYPTMISFDPADVPNNMLFATASGSILITIQIF